MGPFFRVGRARSVSSVLVALVVPAVALLPVVAFGEPTKKLPPAVDVKYDPDNIVAISQFMETLSKGTAKFVAKDFPAAIDTYKKAIQLNPKHALGPYMLAEAYLATGNLPEADAAIAAAQEVAPTDNKNVALRARVLFLRADIYERQKKWDLARTTWQSYNEIAGRVADGGAYPQSGTERLRAIQKEIDVEKATASVRDRIAADKADAGAKKK